MKLNTTAMKVLTLVAIIGLLMLALMRIGSLVDERQQRAAEARRSIEQSQAGSQTLLGPVLSAQCHEEWQETTRTGATAVTVTQRRDFLAAMTPDALKTAGTVATESRYRGIFKVNTYVAHLKLSASWTPMLPTAVNKGGRIACEPPRITVALGDSRGLRDAQVHVDGKALPVEAGTPFEKLPSGFQAAMPSWVPTQAISTEVTLDLVGTGDLAFAPVGDTNEIQLASDWSHPSFGGRFLPVQRDVGDGFKATWRISALASRAARDFVAGEQLCAGVSPSDETDSIDHAVAQTASANCIETFGVAFIDPVNPYSLSDRALKYGLLFIALSFVAVGMVEVLRNLRVHPVQYLLVGCALSVFFLLLLSLSEHLAFGVSYAIASAACVLLLAYYGRHVLGGWLAGTAFGAGIAALYGALYLLLQMEQTAMAIGSVMLFAVLAAVMVLTRRVDWYRLMHPSTPAM